MDLLSKALKIFSQGESSPELEKDISGSLSEGDRQEIDLGDIDSDLKEEEKLNLVDQSGMTIDTSNDHLDTLDMEGLLQKRNALVWIETSGSIDKGNIPFFQIELDKINAELVKRGVDITTL